MAPRSVAVIGGGISGLAAAFLLRDSGLEVIVLEGSPRLGGKLAVSEVAGVPVDAGAEALLARRPEGTDLIAAAGLAGELVLPGTTAAGIWTRGQLRPLPRRQFMGVPADFDELAATGILSGAGLARARDDLTRPASPADGDQSVTSRVGGRFGAELVDRLVEPLLGGVYAGSCDDLSFEATLPALAQAARGHSSLAEAAASLLPPELAEIAPGVTLTTNMNEAIRGADVIMMLRVQLERQHEAAFPASEYFQFYGLRLEHLSLAKPEVIVMHPGPINRGREISSEVADSQRSVILTQVENGIAIRMAVLERVLQPENRHAHAAD